ncbi:hypothetical protein B0J13DRAFT_532563 [Dactylonectria estremocensis]|uniref:Uncharacterized protein n=1 Tax=Dactylonectria estremocensis TaxID=1079267 RepID=A0A9P9IG62_9HYPO|nr:hypothetical protein B0J13DRAFT_532563 [Dactylonectria estremocensis]
MKLSPDGVGVAEGLELACAPLLRLPPVPLPLVFVPARDRIEDCVEDRVKDRVEDRVCDGVEARDGGKSASISACVRSRRMLAVIRRTLLGLWLWLIVLEAAVDGVDDGVDDDDDVIVVIVSSLYRDLRFKV